MFPSQKLQAVRHAMRQRTGFNGAGMFPSQKYALRDRHAVFQQASMGPGCFHPRNNVFAVTSLKAIPLQWGRDVSIPEMRMERLGRKLHTRLQWGRDVSIPESTQVIALVSRGLMLQWGRDVSIPEIRLVQRAGLAISRFNGAGMFPSQK